MADYTVKINVDNAAFADGKEGNELARILCHLASHCALEGQGCSKSLAEFNGNKVGEAIRTA